MKRNVLNSLRLSELKKEKHKSFTRKILLFFIGLVVTFAILAYLSRISKLNISDIEVIGNNIIDTQLIKTTAQREISGNYLWVFPKTNILFYPKDNIRKSLSEDFKRIKDINLSIKDNKTLAISLTERTGEYMWCGEMFNLEIPIEKCYFLDGDGYIFDEAPYFSGEVYFKFYGLVDLPVDEVSIPSGSYFSKQNFKKLILFKQTLEDMGLKPVMLYIEDSGDIKMFLSKGKKLQTGPEIIFKTSSDLDNIAENLKSALSTEPLQSEFKNKYSSLLYIDLRFANKVYYKFSI